MEAPPLIARYYRQTIEALEAEDKTAAKVAMHGYFQYGYSVLTDRG